MKRIILVEDEVDLRENYTVMLQSQAYLVESYASKKQAEQAFSGQLPDLVILDIGLQDDINAGFDLCRQLRKRSEVLPIIFLTARNSDIDTISGLRLGADDYLSKDISLHHLMARIEALFRRVELLKNSVVQSSVQTDNQGLKLDLERLEVFWYGNKIDLTITELWVLQALSLHPGHVKSREQLMQAANTVVDDNTITAQIKRIRNKFIAVDEQFNCIESVYGAGYRWQCKAG